MCRSPSWSRPLANRPLQTMRKPYSPRTRISIYLSTETMRETMRQNWAEYEEAGRASRDSLWHTISRREAFSAWSLMSGKTCAYWAIPRSQSCGSRCLCAGFCGCMLAQRVWCVRGLFGRVIHCDIWAEEWKQDHDILEVWHSVLNVSHMLIAIGI
jgi:MoaA/NifB/PqqE/SkfB family radical SAM enzyme